MSYQSMEEIYKRCEEKGIEFWKAIQLEDAEERDVREICGESHSKCP